MKQLALPAAVLCGLLLAQCRRAEPVPPAPVDPLTLLPPETRNGAGTMGCLINGKPYATIAGYEGHGDWLSSNELGLMGTMYENGDAFKPSSTVGMTLRGQYAVDGTGRYKLIPYSGGYPIFSSNWYEFIVDASLGTTYFSGKYIRTGQVELLKFDGAKRIAAGRFAFTLYEPGRADTLRVTNGRFDLKFY